MTRCKLCEYPNLLPIMPPNDKRSYWFCEICGLITADPKFYPNVDLEKKRYLEHNNNLENTGYVDFLKRIIDPSLKWITKKMTGLDYGCGHTPLLSQILSKEGITCYNYDPIFEIHHPLQNYDFIFATESFEHFFDPAKELNSIGKILKKGGILGIMTEQWESLERFNGWYYKRDFTHVNFFNAKTFEFICEKFKYKVIYKDRNRVVIMEKK